MITIRSIRSIVLRYPEAFKVQTQHSQSFSYHRECPCPIEKLQPAHDRCKSVPPSLPLWMTHRSHKTNRSSDRTATRKSGEFLQTKDRRKNQKGWTTGPADRFFSCLAFGRSFAMITFDVIMIIYIYIYVMMSYDVLCDVPFSKVAWPLNL